MHRLPTQQPLLPFEVNDLWPTIPMEARDCCRTLLARLLLHTVRTEELERRRDEYGEDPSKPS